MRMTARPEGGAHTPLHPLPSPLSPLPCSLTGLLFGTPYVVVASQSVMPSESTDGDDFDDEAVERNLAGEWITKAKSSRRSENTVVHWSQGLSNTESMNANQCSQEPTWCIKPPFRASFFPILVQFPLPPCLCFPSTILSFLFSVCCTVLQPPHLRCCSSVLVKAGYHHSP